MTHGALPLSIALGVAVVALLTPVAPATAESPRMGHMDSRDPRFMDMDFAPVDQRFIMDSPEVGFTVRRCALFTVAAIDTL